LLLLAIACCAPGARAGFGGPRAVPPPGPYRVGSSPPPTPAERYAALDGASCEQELTARGVAFSRVDEAWGVLEPLRLGRPTARRDLSLTWKHRNHFHLEVKADTKWFYLR
jgi:hypothetical protein